jgi:hypothetical protein
MFIENKTVFCYQKNGRMSIVLPADGPGRGSYAAEKNSGKG